MRPILQGLYRRCGRRMYRWATAVAACQPSLLLAAAYAYKVFDSLLDAVGTHRQAGCCAVTGTTRSSLFGQQGPQGLPVHSCALPSCSAASMAHNHLLNLLPVNAMDFGLYNS